MICNRHAASRRFPDQLNQKKIANALAGRFAKIPLSAISRFSLDSPLTHLGPRAIDRDGPSVDAIGMSLIDNRFFGVLRHGSRISFAQVCTHVAAVIFLLLMAAVANAANFRTQNFIVLAPTPDLAKAVGEAAEKYRNDLAVYWTGEPLRPWPAPCPVRVIAGPTLAAQGVTTYNPAPVRDFQMEVVGTPERILDSVLPHEVTHTVLATHFGRPLPRWADEGICTTVEHDSERNKHEAKLREFLHSRRGIPMNQLFLLTEYPNDVLPMYAQGYSVCQFLIAQKGPQEFIQFLHDYIQHPSWTANVKRHYDYDSLAELQKYWVDWVSAGSGPVARFAKVQPNSDASDVAALGTIAQASATAPIKSLPAEVIPASTPAPDRLAAAPTGAGKTLTLAAAQVPQDQHPQDQGWYQRQRTKTQSDSAIGSIAGAAIRPIVPPSIRQSGLYRSAQPQQEQGISRAGRQRSGFRADTHLAKAGFDQPVRAAANVIFSEPEHTRISPNSQKLNSDGQATP